MRCCWWIMLAFATAVWLAPCNLVAQTTIPNALSETEAEDQVPTAAPINARPLTATPLTATPLVAPPLTATSPEVVPPEAVQAAPAPRSRNQTAGAAKQNNGAADNTTATGNNGPRFLPIKRERDLRVIRLQPRREDRPIDMRPEEPHGYKVVRPFGGNAPPSSRQAPNRNARPEPVIIYGPRDGVRTPAPNAGNTRSGTPDAAQSTNQSTGRLKPNDAQDVLEIYGEGTAR